MPSATSRSLTERQSAVMERIDRRVPIKVIAQELGVSETRINQHIRALKDVFEVDSLNELVEEYRASNPRPKGDKDAADHAASKEHLSEPVYTKKQLPNTSDSEDTDSRDDAGEVILSDVLPGFATAPWMRPDEPRVVPGVLDGEHAVLLRLATIIGIAFGFLAAVVLTVTAAITISEALDGRAAVPVDEQGFS
ncbi:MAG: LuxR C-terminal-related transcriptional regulator [Pseudomonadota bacterium]